jgi:formate/nitrite transporter FocA (FNT family)
MTEAKESRKNSHPDDTTPDTRRLTAAEIFQAAIENAREELRRSNRKLAFSGLTGGLTMGLTALSVASVQAMASSGPSQQIAPYLIYPIGFITVIIGRAGLGSQSVHERLQPSSTRH